ncbi:MAG: hypothetical protein MUO33_05125 [Sedimentisphaerales bacterium]|nr:hypothetical protein [Sedimentisphaerales bacterium]
MCSFHDGSLTLSCSPNGKLKKCPYLVNRAAGIKHQPSRTKQLANRQFSNRRHSSIQHRANGRFIR